MNAPPAMSFAFPKPRRALWIVLIALTVLGIFTAFLATWIPGGVLVFLALGCKLDPSPVVAFAQPWRLLTSGLLTSPDHWTHLGLSLLGLYFLGRSARAAVGLVAVRAVSGALGPRGQPDRDRRRPGRARGGAGAFSPRLRVRPHGGHRRDRDRLVARVRAVDGEPLLLPAGARQGPLLDHHRVLRARSHLPAGLAGGRRRAVRRASSPGCSSGGRRRSRARHGCACVWPSCAAGRRRSRVDDVLAPKPKRRPRAGGPPLRVVPGGLEEVLKKRTPAEGQAVPELAGTLPHPWDPNHTPHEACLHARATMLTRPTKHAYTPVRPCLPAPPSMLTRPCDHAYPPHQACLHARATMLTRPTKRAYTPVRPCLPAPPGMLTRPCDHAYPPHQACLHARATMLTRPTRHAYTPVRPPPGRRRRSPARP